MPRLIYIALDPKCFLHFWPHTPPSPRPSLLPWQLLCMTVSCMSCHRQWYFPWLCGALHHSRLVGWHAQSYEQLAHCDQWDNVGVKWATYLIVTCCHLGGENVSSCILQRKVVGCVPGSAASGHGAHVKCWWEEGATATPKDQTVCTHLCLLT